ncbi:MAG: GW dipeptide domain-containing protein [Leptolyngbyaceae cyanobacterium bins.302]|nr:GW dipeptide domain-containing protein [Leptolyngbyaceae cyanobacterium bins.302]
MVVATVASVGVALPSFARPATLIAQNPNSRINVRSTPSPSAASPHYGLAGDRVDVMRATVGKDQYMWNYVKFSSGAKGWVRGDFVRYTEGMAKYAILGGNAGDRINVRSAPSTSAASPHFGLAGDVVQVLTQKTASDGYVWRYVQFPSGAEGWIRGDLVRGMEEGGC